MIEDLEPPIYADGKEGKATGTRQQSKNASRVETGQFTEEVCLVTRDGQYGHYDSVNKVFWGEMAKAPLPASAVDVVVIKGCDTATIPKGAGVFCKDQEHAVDFYDFTVGASSPAVLFVSGAFDRAGNARRAYLKCVLT